MTSDDHDLVHPAYRHLDRTIRLAGLSLVQWAQLVIAGATAYVLAGVLPFGGTYNTSVAVTVAGVPVAAALSAGASGARPLALALAALRWRRHARMHLPGAGCSAAGYRLAAPQAGDGAQERT